MPFELQRPEPRVVGTNQGFYHLIIWNAAASESTCIWARGRCIFLLILYRFCGAFGGWTRTKHGIKFHKSLFEHCTRSCFELLFLEIKLLISQLISRKWENVWWSRNVRHLRLTVENECWTKNVPVKEIQTLNYSD